MDAPFLDDSHQLIRKETVTELCARRDSALRLYEASAQLLKEAREEHLRACVGLRSISTVPLDELRSSVRKERFTKIAREILDRDMWMALLCNTDLGILMDHEERRLFQESLSDPAEVTPETVFATVDRLRADSGMIFRRGLVNAFKGLSREYKSHDGFKIGSRVVLEGIVEVNVYSSWTAVHLRSYSVERLRDVDRVFHRLDGLKPPEHGQGLCQAIQTAIDKKDWEIETPYFKVRWFKNGNAHLWFLRSDLLELSNRLIAEHFGLVIGAASHVAQKRNWRVGDKVAEIDDFYQTPGWLAQEMVDKAGIEPHHRVLEPQAGEGAIARLVSPIVGGGLTCIETSAERVAVLKEALPDANVHCGDFLSHWGRREYDRILMNPPFSSNADVAHVTQAMKFLARGGRLVAVMSAGILFRTDKATAALRTTIEALGGSIEPLPAGTFKAAGTNVNTALVIVDFD
jgi:protein-L-isoaspartate O-methyltransferase